MKSMMKYNNNWKEFEQHDYDRNFETDRTYSVESFLYNHRIRIVRYPDSEKYSVFRTSLLKFPKFVWNFVEKNMEYGKYLDKLHITKSYSFTKEELKSEMNYTL